MDLSREARDVIISNGSCKKLLEWSNKEDTFCWIRVLKKSHKNEKFSINESQLKFLEWAHPARAYLTFCATTSTTTTATATKQITIQSTKSNLVETKEPAEYGAALFGRLTYARIYEFSLLLSAPFKWQNNLFTLLGFQFDSLRREMVAWTLDCFNVISCWENTVQNTVKPQHDVKP